MTALVIMPVWEVLLIMLVTVPMVAIPSSMSGARYGARLAVKLCAQHWGCPMKAEAARDDWKHRLKQQHAELLKKHPEAEARRRAAEDRDRDGTE